MADIPVEEMEVLAERMEYYGIDTRTDQEAIALFLARKGKRPSPGMRKLAKRIVVFESRLKIRAARSRPAADRLFRRERVARSISSQAEQAQEQEAPRRRKLRARNKPPESARVKKRIDWLKGILRRRRRSL